MKNRPIVLTGSALHAFGFIIAILSLTEKLNFPFPYDKAYAIGREANLIIGILCIVTGAALLIYHFEQHFLNSGKKGKLSLLLLAGLPAVIILTKKFPKIPFSEKPKQTDTTTTGKKVYKTGIVVSVLAVLLTPAAMLFVLSISTTYFLYIPSQVKNDEITAYKNIQKIAKAQQIYYEEDRDENGKKDYALFFIHLWQGVDENARPKEINLISKELGFALRSPYALDGYFFVDIHSRFFKVQGEYKSRYLDSEKEFVIGAFPQYNKKTGHLVYLIDEKGKLFAKTLDVVPLDNTIGNFTYPPDPKGNGWTEIHNEEGIKALQKKVDYGIIQIKKYTVID